MSALSKILRSYEGGQVAFWCPGCDTSHTVSVAPGGWGYNGNADRPTFEPSVLVRAGHHSDRNNGSCWCTFYKENPPAPGERVFKCFRCHSFVRDGQIQFLDDCSHDLKGQTVPLPAWPEGEE